MFSIGTDVVDIRIALMADIESGNEQVYTVQMKASLIGDITYKTVTSSPIDVTVRNPCAYTLEFGDFELDAMTITVLAENAETQQFSEPTTNIVFSDGESCGEFEYSVIKKDSDAELFAYMDTNLERTIAAQTDNDDLKATSRTMQLIVKFADYDI